MSKKYQLPGLLLKRAKIASIWSTVYYIFTLICLGGLIGCMVDRRMESVVVLLVISMVSFSAGFMFSAEGKCLKKLHEGLEKYTDLLEEKDGLYNKLLKKIESQTKNEKEENENGTL